MPQIVVDVKMFIMQKRNIERVVGFVSVCDVCLYELSPVLYMWILTYFKTLIHLLMHAQFILPAIESGVATIIRLGSLSEPAETTCILFYN